MRVSTSAGPKPERPKTSALSVSVAATATRRPSSVRASTSARRSDSWGVRSTSPAASSRSTALVTEVGWTCRSADALDIRIRFSREKFSSASSSYRAKVSP